MTLEFNPPRTFKGIEDFSQWAWDNFKRAEQEFNAGRDAFYLKELFAEPKKPRNGMIVWANGTVDAGPPATGWNPGSGAGIYAYYGGTWQKLG